MLKTLIVIYSQTKRDRGNPMLISDHLRPPPPWGQRDETRHRGGHLSIIICPKPLAFETFPFFSTNYEQKSKSKSFSERLLAWPFIIESLSVSTDLGGTLWRTGVRPFEGEITISSQTRGDTSFLRPNGEHFGQPERRAPGGPFLKYLLDQANAWTNLNEF